MNKIKFFVKGRSIRQPNRCAIRVIGHLVVPLLLNNALSLIWTQFLNRHQACLGPICKRVPSTSVTRFLGWHAGDPGSNPIASLVLIIYWLFLFLISCHSDYEHRRRLWRRTNITCTWPVLGSHDSFPYNKKKTFLSSFYFMSKLLFKGKALITTNVRKMEKGSII